MCAPLSEADSKDLLSRHGVPVVADAVVDDVVAGRRWRFAKRIVWQLFNGIRDVDAEFGAWCLHDPPAPRP